MSVYVDDQTAPYGSLIMCHMIADSTKELLAMVDRIGVQRKWIQDAGTYREHFDVCQSKRALAVRSGAIPIGRMQFGRKLRDRRDALAPSQQEKAPQ